ncbi:MAG: hypothetical protein KJ977_02925 [Candidatus Omnitrophica bacterium]|nr:hypothetical protein [Candidatus Omnitrophota bacterium]MBU2265971.1 hypothetical protein [Candidatus Omnitrophota bacterium]MBU2474016.1 hypothetical protein [Candidatus Omnitrophota bacterium]
MGVFKNFNLKKAVTHNFWLKLIALVIAVFVWLYVAGTITSGGRFA